MASMHMTASNSASKASSWRPTRSSGTPGNRARARASIPVDWSVPTTRRPASSTMAKYLPVPQAASRTVPPG